MIKLFILIGCTIAAPHSMSLDAELAVTETLEPETENIIFKEHEWQEFIRLSDELTNTEIDFEIIYGR